MSPNRRTIPVLATEGVGVATMKHHGAERALQLASEHQAHADGAATRLTTQITAAVADESGRVLDVGGAPARTPAEPDHATPRRITPEDWHRLRGYVGEILTALGMDLCTPGTKETPERFLRALLDLTAGYEGDPKLLTAFPAERRGLDSAFGQIVEGPIAFYALCEHHALPFFGVAHLGYIAGDEIIGISKLTRLVRLFARRFTVQERLGEQIADTLTQLIGPHGVAVHLQASHLCTRMRGVEEDSHTITTVWRGAFRDPDLRREFLDEVRGSR